MKIPDGPAGVPTVSASGLRTYGAGGFRLTDQEADKGCPRLWRKKYVEHAVPEERSFPLKYGSMIHRVLYRMEEEAIGPEEALDLEFDVDLPPEAFREALDDLTNYIERGNAPVDRYGTIAVETMLDAVLYVDEDFGEIRYRGIMDWMGLDLNEPDVLHGVDYKSNRFPPSLEQVKGDVQLKGYAWLLIQNAKTFLPGVHRPRVVMHLDAIKWRDIEWEYPADDLEAWHSWAVAVVRQILRDEEGLPVLNDGCGWCPVKGDCPAFQGLPEEAALLLTTKPEASATDDQRIAWRDRAYKQMKLLEKGVKEVDEMMVDRTLRLGRVTTKAYEFIVDTDWATRIDARAMHRVLGDAFYDCVTVGKGKVETLTKQWPPEDLAAVLEVMRRVPVGTKVKKTARKE